MIGCLFTLRNDHHSLYAVRHPTKLQFFFPVIRAFKNLFMAVLGLHCCTGLSLVAVCGLLTAVASLVAEPGLLGTQAPVVATYGFSRCGSWASEHRINSCGTQA